MAKKYPEPPDSFDPVDWWMYSDILQEMGAPAARWRKAKRVGDSLHAEPRLLLWAIDPGDYYPRVVIDPILVFNPATGKMRDGLPYPVWVKPAHVHLLRWNRARIPSGITPGDRWLNGAFTPDRIRTDRFSLALYRYACDWGESIIPGFGEAYIRLAFIECHGRLNVQSSLDVRKPWIN